MKVKLHFTATLIHHPGMLTFDMLNQSNYGNYEIAA